MKQFRHNLRGKVLKRITTAGCMWCKCEKDPAPKPICVPCHNHFKALLSSSKWQRHRRYFLSLPENHYCRNCRTVLGSAVPATVVDHIKPWSLHPTLFWVETNHQPLCHTCHTRKTKTDGTVHYHKNWGQ